jgi:integrase/uncharacterized coiled-coil protein SlyX
MNDWRRIDQFQHLLASPSVERLLRNKAHRTKYEYLNAMNRFLNFAAPELGVKDPDAWVAWAKSRPDSLEVQDVIDKFAETQASTRKPLVTSMLRSHLKRNGFTNLPSVEWVSPLKEFHPGFKREEVQALLGYLDHDLQKLYVLFAKDSGLRARDILSLQYHHVKKDLEAGSEFVHLYLEPAYYNRKKSAGITFIGPNTAKLLRKLISDHEVSTEPGAFIFSFNYNAINEALLLAKKKAKLDPLIQSSHGLRKFFEQSLDRVGMDVHKKLQLEGHSQGVRVHYTDRNIDDLRQLYQQAYRFLDLSEEAAADNRVRELEKTVAEQRQHIEALKVEADKVTKFKEELADQRKMLEELLRKQSPKSGRK